MKENEESYLVENIIKSMNPTYKECIRVGMMLAKGYAGPFHEYSDKKEVCYLCGRCNDFVCGFINLIPIFDEDTESIIYICDTHRKEMGEFVWNCLTGEKVYLLPNKSLFMDIFQQVILKTYILFRFIYYFVIYTFGWKVMFPIRLKLKQYKGDNYDGK